MQTTANIPRLLLSLLALGGNTALSASLQAAQRSENVVLETRQDGAQQAPEGVLAFPVSHTHVHTDTQKIKRRQEGGQQVKDTDVQVFNMSSVSYLIELSIGTPGQLTKVAIDTGSSELWVNPNCLTAQSRTQAQDCIENGKYDTEKSSTAIVSDITGGVRYGIGEVDLVYVADDIALPGSAVDLQMVQFGYATRSVDLSQGIMGLSFGEGYNMGYKSFVDELVAQDVVETRAFGVALGTKDEDEHSGLLTFGGIDTRKYMGELHTSPILEPRADERGLYRYWVTMDSLGITNSEGSSSTYSDSRVNLFFDTGATLSYLPRPLVEQLASDLGARYSQTIGLYLVPCGLDGTIDFTFGNFTVNVHLDEFIWDLEDGRTCALGAEAADDEMYILGDSFLRSVYAVFDMDSPSIHFAHYVNCGSNLQKIPTGRNAAGQFEGECTQEDLDSQNASSRGGSGGDDSAAGRFSASMWLAVGSAVAVQLVSLV